MLGVGTVGFGTVDVVGYAGSALVVASLTMVSVVRLRALSLAGAVTFVVYGALIAAVPIVITNVVIAGINVWFLRRELGRRRDLGAAVIDANSPFLADFVRVHLDDIRRFQPAFRMPERNAVCVLLTREGLPAGAVIGERDGNRLDVTLDYVLREWRDSRLGGWLFTTGARVFRDLGITQLTSEPGDEVHRAYLERMGFSRNGDRYVLDLR